MSHKPYQIEIPIPPQKEAEMNKLLQNFQNIKIESIAQAEIVIDKWGGEDIKTRAIIYKIRINSISNNTGVYTIESRAIIADFLKIILQKNILSINQMKLVSIINGFGLNEKITPNSDGRIARIGLSDK